MHTATYPTLSSPSLAETPAAHLATLAEDARLFGSPSAFQATLVALRNALRRVTVYTTTARAAALSLAQHERLDAMRAELTTLDDALDTVLDTTGRCLLSADESSVPPAEAAKRPRLRLWNRAASERLAPPPSWSVSVTALLGVLDTQVDRLETLANGQPECAPSRLLADEVTALLTRHRASLEVEVLRWAA